jgi:hypothetical protein
MKQGRASRDVRESTKVEPQARAKSIDAVTNIGLQQVYMKPKPQLMKGRGYEAPAPVSQKTSNSGSQGKH